MTEQAVVQPTQQSLVSIVFKSGYTYEAWYNTFTTEVVGGKVKSLSYTYANPAHSLHHIDMKEIALIVVKRVKESCTV